MIPWAEIKAAAKKYNTDPYLLAAIGQHETGWGSLGAGRDGWFTGYGIGQEEYRGLEAQIEGTARKMSAWGIGPDEVSLSTLLAGNAGNLKSGIYAEDQGWPSKVWQYYKKIVGAGMSSQVEKVGGYDGGSSESPANLSGTGTEESFNIDLDNLGLIDTGAFYLTKISLIIVLILLIVFTLYQSVGSLAK